MRELALNCLMWAIYAKEPLETEALQGALATARECKSEQDAEIDEVDVILEACCGLLEESGDHRDRTIRPIHFSVQEFFTKPSRGSTNGGIWGLIANPTSAHVELSRICLVSLHLAPSELLHLKSEYPFAVYAARFFDHHLFECGGPENVLPLVDDVLSRDGVFLSSLFQLRRMRTHLPWSGMYVCVDLNSFPLSAGVIIYATQLYEIPSIRTRWAGSRPPKNALHHASSAGLLSAVGRLLEQGYDVDERDSDGVAAIHYASEGGHNGIAEILLSSRAEIDAQCGQYGTALQAASAGGHNKIVELLLSKDADVNVQGGDFGNALTAASAGGHDQIVELLLSKGADVNAQGGWFGNALAVASEGGYDKTVELLLSKGADVNAQGGWFGNALAAASKGGYDKIVELLLDKGADVNTQGGEFGSALRAASRRGHVKMVELLLSKGAEIDAQGGGFAPGGIERWPRQDC